MRQKLKGYMKLSLRDNLVTILMMLIMTLSSAALRLFDQSNYYVSMLYILAVFLIARTTDGYFYGVFSALLAVLLVNYFFTYPYFRFNFTLAGYPIAIISMLAVSLTTSALTSQAKQNAEAKLEAEREKTRSNLLRAVSHDLRTPLTAILGASSAILENDDTITGEERLSLLRDVRDDAQWLIRMVENLLTITRMDGQTGARLVKTEEAAEEVLEAAVTKFKRQYPQWKVSIQVPDEFLLIPMDAILIEQVLMNLLENVVHHGVGADHIHVSLARVGHHGMFTVRDNGCGIDSAVLPLIFSGRLTANYGSAGDSKRNMGIGLSVCHTIIQAHNGVMEAGNLEDGGAEFRFALPLEETYE